jgi:uncharacterized protein YqjF (DUF2071 family)
VSRQGAVVRNTVRRRLGGDARLQLGLKLGLAISHETLGDLDHFLTARWVLYSGVGKVAAAILTEHPRWSFRQAELTRLTQTITVEAGLPPAEGPPIVHFSDGVDARLSWPRVTLLDSSSPVVPAAQP